MPSITFTGVRVSTGNFNNDGGAVNRTFNVVANLTKSVREAMGWAEIPDCADSAKLHGELHAQNLVLSPNDDKLLKYEIECECSSVSGFEVKRPQEKDAPGRKTELRFKLETVERGALAKFENYCEKVGEAPAQLKIGFTEQEELPLGKEGSAVVEGKKGAAGA